MNKIDKSSILGLNSNTISLFVYLLPMLISLIVPSTCFFIWIIPLVFLLLESKSDFVIYHASNSLAFCLISSYIYLLVFAFDLNRGFSNAFVTLCDTKISIGLDVIINIGLCFGLIMVELYILISRIILIFSSFFEHMEIEIPFVIHVTRFIQEIKNKILL
ncbi:MAG: hypothetical protein ACI4U3_06165 [Traorella sp.]